MIGGAAAAGGSAIAGATIPTIIAAGAAGIAAGGAIGGGLADNRLAKQQAAADERQGLEEIKASSERATRIRMHGQRFLAEQRVQFLNSGIEAGSGSALEVGGADAGEIELDALTELYGGVSQNRMLRERAAFTRTAGKNAKNSGYINAVSEILGAETLWKGFGKPKNVTL